MIKAVCFCPAVTVGGNLGILEMKEPRDIKHLMTEV